MKIWTFLAVAGAVVTVGGAVFLFTRDAAAASAGRKGFKVSADCTSVEVVDEDAAKEALIAGATANFHGMDQKAIDLIILALGVAIRDSHCPVNDYMRVSGIPGVPLPMTIGQIRAIVGDRTLEEVQELAAKGELPGVPGFDAASDPLYMDSVEPTHANPVSAILAWTTGGEYP